MAYVYTSDFELIDTASASATPTLLPHVTNDLLMICITQDIGSSSITTASSGWAMIGTGAASGGCRQQWAYKIAASGAEPDPTFSGTNDTWIFQKFVIKDADTTTPIDVSARVDFNNPAGGLVTSGTVTTTADNALLMYSMGSDGASVSATVDPDEMLTLLITPGTAESAVVGWANKLSTGLTTAINLKLSTDAEGGNVWVIAIKNKSGGLLAPFCTSVYTPIRYYGGTGTTGNFSALSTIAATIAGLPTSATLGTVSTGSIPEVFVSGQSFTFGTAPASATYQGAVDTLSSAINLTNKLVSFVFRSPTALANSRLLSSGFFFLVADSANNYIVYQIIPGSQYVANQTYVFVANIGTGTIFTSSGTIDYTDITKFGWFVERNAGTTTSSDLRVKNLFIHDEATLVGGNATLPAKLSTVYDYLTGGLSNFGVSSFQGAGQLLVKQSIQFGDGSTPTFVNLSANSLEIPVYNETYQKPSTQKYLPVDDAVNVEIYASASDTMNFASSIFASQRQNTFTINASSSASATYDFAGMSIIGYEVTNNVSGVVFNAITFSGTRGITLNGGGMDECTVSDSLTTPAVTTNNPENITDTTFVSAGTGHAIEITTPGTYDFTGNVFTGYGADATTDAAIYNNSGGAVELIIPLGDATPTVRNGTGASTTITQPTNNQSVTLTNGVANSRVQIYDLTSNTELVNQVVTTFPFTWTDSVPYVADREIRLRVAYQSGATAKIFIDQVIGTATNASPAVNFLLNQENDAVYITNAIDGSTVTTVTIDDTALLVEVDTGSISLATIYAYETYWLYTEAGIRDEGRFILAVDPANYQLFDFKIKNVSSPTAPLVLTGGYVIDGDTGQAIDVIDTTGGTIFLAPEHVVAYAAGSGVTAGDIVSIADAVWDEALSGHATAGTTGKKLSDTATSSGGGMSVGEFLALK